MRIALAILGGAAAFFATVGLLAVFEAGPGPVRSFLPIAAAGGAFFAISGRRFMEWFAGALPDTREPGVSRTADAPRPRPHRPAPGSRGRRDRP